MIIELNDLKFAYPETPDSLVLDIEQWAITEKEQVFIQGPPGCGKSTLLNILSGMQSATQGQISVLGERLDKLSDRQRDRFRANHVGVVFQTFNLIPYLNAVDNIRLAHYFSKEKNKRHEMADIKALLSELSISTTDRQRPTAHLSIGQQQRVAIARALINRPQLLIADEPTSSLDQPNRDAFMSMLLPMVTTYDITLLFVSHDPMLAQHFHRTEQLTQINRAGTKHNYVS